MPENYVCVKCGKVTKTKQALERHAAYHEDVRPFSCEICLQRFKNSDDRGKHYRRLKKDGKFEIACQVCHKHFKSKDLLKQHEEILGCLSKAASEDLVIEAKDGSEVIPDKCSTLADDVNSYTQDSQYGENSLDSKNNILDNTVNKNEVKCACKICEAAFSKVDDLKKHYREIHKDTKRHVCIQCGQTLSSKDSLARHYSIFHQSEFPFQCDLCDQRFKIKEGLCRHVRFIHKDKGYACDVCGRIFTQPVNLKKHMMMHNGKKDFKCSACGGEFRWKQAFQKHLLKHKDNGFVSHTLDTSVKGDVNSSIKFEDDFNNETDDKNRDIEDKSEDTVSIAGNGKYIENDVEYFATKAEESWGEDADEDNDTDDNDELDADYKAEGKFIENMEVKSEAADMDSERCNKRQWAKYEDSAYNQRQTPGLNHSEHSGDMFSRVLEFAEIVTEFGSKDMDVENAGDDLIETDNDMKGNIRGSHVSISKDDVGTCSRKRRKVFQGINDCEFHKEYVGSMNGVDVDPVEVGKVHTHKLPYSNDLRAVDTENERIGAFEKNLVSKSRNVLKGIDERMSIEFSKERIQNSKLNTADAHAWESYTNMEPDENNENLIGKRLTSEATGRAMGVPRFVFKPSFIHKLLESPKDVEPNIEKPDGESKKSVEILKPKNVSIPEASVLHSESRGLTSISTHIGSPLGQQRLKQNSTDENNVLVKKFHIKVAQISSQSSVKENGSGSPTFGEPESNKTAKDVGGILNLSRTPDAGKFSLVKHMLSLQNEENFDQAIFRNPLYSTLPDVNGFKNQVERHRISDLDGDRLYDLSAKQNIPFLWLGMTKFNGKSVDVNGSHDQIKQSPVRHDERDDPVENMEHVNTASERCRGTENKNTDSEVYGGLGNRLVASHDCRDSNNRLVAANRLVASHDSRSSHSNRLVASHDSADSNSDRLVASHDSGDSNSNRLVASQDCGDYNNRLVAANRLVASHGSRGSHSNRLVAFHDSGDSNSNRLVASHDSGDSNNNRLVAFHGRRDSSHGLGAGNRLVLFHDSGDSNNISHPLKSCSTDSNAGNEKSAWSTEPDSGLGMNVKYKLTGHNSYNESYGESGDNSSKETGSKFSSDVIALASKHSQYDVQYWTENCDLIAQHEDQYFASEGTITQSSALKLTGNVSKKSESNGSKGTGNVNQWTIMDCFQESNPLHDIGEIDTNFVKSNFSKNGAAPRLSLGGQNWTAHSSVNGRESVSCSSKESGTMFGSHHPLAQHSSHVDLFCRQNSYPFNSSHQSLNPVSSLAITPNNAQSAVAPPCLIRSQSEIHGKQLQKCSNKLSSSVERSMLMRENICENQNSNLLTHNSIYTYSRSHGKNLLTPSSGDDNLGIENRRSRFVASVASQYSVTSENTGAGEQNTGREISKKFNVRDGVSILDLLDADEKI